MGLQVHAVQFSGQTNAVEDGSTGGSLVGHNQRAIKSEEWSTSIILPVS
jgi:hypothetical protein